MADSFAIGGVSLRIADCWWLDDIGPLLSGSAQLGDDRVVPGAAGVIPYPRVETVTKINLKLTVMGYRDKAGSAHPDTRTGIALNAAQLQADMTQPPATADGTRSATLTVGSLATLTKPVHVLGEMDFGGYGPNGLRGVLRLSFPEGLFDLTEWLP